MSSSEAFSSSVPVDQLVEVGDVGLVVLAVVVLERLLADVAEPGRPWRTAAAGVRKPCVLSWISGASVVTRPVTPGRWTGGTARTLPDGCEPFSSGRRGQSHPATAVRTTNTSEPGSDDRRHAVEMSAERWKSRCGTPEEEPRPAAASTNGTEQRHRRHARDDREGQVEAPEVADQVLVVGADASSPTSARSRGTSRRTTAARAGPRRRPRAIPIRGRRGAGDRGSPRTRSGRSRASCSPPGPRDLDDHLHPSRNESGTPVPIRSPHGSDGSTPDAIGRSRGAPTVAFASTARGIGFR